MVQFLAYLVYCTFSIRIDEVGRRTKKLHHDTRIIPVTRLGSVAPSCYSHWPKALDTRQRHSQLATGNSRTQLQVVQN